MAQRDIYRIREGIFERCNGYRCWRARGYIAERQVCIFGFRLWWWPVGEWHEVKGQCLYDIDFDQRLRVPVAKPERVNTADSSQGRS